MRGPRGTLGVAAVAVAVSLGVSAPALGAAGAARGARPGGARPAAIRPAVTLTAAQPAITAERFGREAESSGTGFRLAVGTYTMTETITAPFRKVLGLPAATSSATVTVKVVKGQSGSAGERRHHVSRTLPRLPAVRTMTSPPRAALPDMVPLPSWGIQLKIRHKKNGHPAVDHLNFDATVAIDGNSPLEVQGFRSGSGPGMDAFQYFFLHGKIIGRAPAGTMLFDNAPDEQEWHFQQFARYRLLDASRTTAVLSHKEAFCIAPTDAYDLLHPGATWVPAFTGLGDGNCGQATALWMREQLPLGWSDTYTQSSDGQNFNVTDLPNGTYYIEIIANPEKVLHETNMANDVSLRKIILGGTPDHRTLRVPPFTAVPRGA